MGWIHTPRGGAKAITGHRGQILKNQGVPNESPPSLVGLLPKTVGGVVGQHILAELPTPCVGLLL